MLLISDEGFLKLHSKAMEREKDEIWKQNDVFVGNHKKFKRVQV